MINLRLRTEYSFRWAFGQIPKVISAVGEAPALGIADRAGTWGHVAFNKAAVKAGKKPIFGLELAVVPDCKLKEPIKQRQHTNYMAFIARNDAGLREIYKLVTEATDREHFHYYPRMDYSWLPAISQDVVILSGIRPVWDRLPREYFAGYTPAQMDWCQSARCDELDMIRVEMEERRR